MATTEYNNIIDDYNKILKSNDELQKEIESINSKIDRRITICDKTPEILENASLEFNKLTSIVNKKDIPFFVFSVLLQWGCKYYIKVLREMNDKELADKTPFHKEEKSERQGNKYYASKEEIISNPVPFDSIQKEHLNSW